MLRSVITARCLGSAALLMVCAAGAATANAATRYVCKSGNDANDGSSWAAAKLTVQAGLNVATAGDQVWVAKGTYIENITLRDGVALYGGLAGTEDPATFDLANRNLAANPTILDGNQAGSVVTSPSGATATTRIDGFTIRNGNGTLISGTNRCGGGIYCDHSSPTIAHNTIMGNSASGKFMGFAVGGANYGSANYGYGWGGGIYCNYSSPTITNNTIRGNRASEAYATGGGIYCSQSSPLIANNTITGNSASGSYRYGPGIGGGIYCAGSSPTIVNNTITGNFVRGPSGGPGGGIYCVSSSPTIANTIVAFNSSGIYNIPTGTPVLRYNCVFGNTDYDYSGLTDPTGSNGNISADPKLVATRYGNLHIQPDSPCRNSGDTAAVQAGTLDMDGQARIQGSDADIGADESDGTTWATGPYVIVRVSPEGNDANDGSTWALAKRTVQAGIDAAEAEGGNVWVKAGTYLEQVTLLPYVHLYGGFAGTETAGDQRDWAAHVTILDGQQNGSVVTAQGIAPFCATIDGFTVRNGNGTLTALGRCGGGIYCRDSSPTIANNAVTSNSVSGATNGFGGGIYCHNSSPTITGNTVTANSASGTTQGSGGGIHCAEYSLPTVANNTISANSASRGGGIYYFNSSLQITKNTITANTAKSGGGIYCDDSSSRITNNRISGNSVSGLFAYGGGIYCSRSLSVITNNLISGNSSSGQAGAIYSDGSAQQIANNTISGNKGFGAIYLNCNDGSNPIVANTIVAFNSGGIYKTGSGPGAPLLRSNCVFGNTAANYYGLTDPTGSNGNISADPLFHSANPGLDGTWATPDDVLDDLRLTSASPCIDAGNNADVPPDVADLDADGNTAEPLPIDLAGRLRFFDVPTVPDTGAGTPPIVDMGAYEYLPPIPADLTDDGYVDGDDLDLFEACATGPVIPYLPAALPEPEPGCTLTADGNGHIAADFDADGDVDVIDFAVLQRCFSAGNSAAIPNCPG